MSGGVTIEQRLRFFDICIDAAKEARAYHPPIGGVTNPRFGPAYNFLRVKMMRQEGLPLSLLGDGKNANQRHFERMNRDFGTRLPWGDVKHETPLEQATRYGRETVGRAAA